MNLHDYLEYKDGKVFWKVDVNKRHAHKGDRAGITRPDGYRTITLFGKKYLEHRLIYFLFHDKWPVCIDHIDRDKSNNYIENLREVSFYENCLNKEGINAEPNINYHQKGYQVIVRKKYIGRFPTLEEAVKARDAVCGI